MVVTASADCIFCRITAGDIASYPVAEAERALAFLDVNPASEGHTLVVPREHRIDIWDLPADDGLAIWALAQHVAGILHDALRPDGMTLYQANRRAGFQDVFHFHLHVVPRWHGDGLRKAWESRPADPGHLAATAERLRSA
jgi:histidine triad (HIT) family protein